MGQPDDEFDQYVDTALDVYLKRVKLCAPLFVVGIATFLWSMDLEGMSWVRRPLLAASAVISMASFGWGIGAVVGVVWMKREKRAHLLEKKSDPRGRR